MTDLNRPSVSVVIPVRDRGRLLKLAVDSVLSQERVSTEVIVVDDGSTNEATAEVLAPYGDRIRVLRNDPPRERGAARNTGARAASGDIVAFLDSDDEWKPAKLTSQIGIVRRGVACVSGVDVIDLNGNVVEASVIPRPPSRERILLWNDFSPSTLVMTKEDFLTVGGFPESRSVQGSEDWLFFVRLFQLGLRIEVVREPLVRYRIHPGAWTADPDRVAFSMWSAVEWMQCEGHVEGDRARRLRALRAAAIGRRYAHAGRWKHAATWGLRALRYSTRIESVRALVLIALSGIRGEMRRRGI